MLQKKIAKNTEYNHYFYECHTDESRQSAREFIPELFPIYKPNSVIDIGCGVGTWLAEFQQQGIQDIQGIDGDYIDLSKLQINSDHFHSADLNKDFSGRFKRKFDLAMTLEVAEHIKPENAERFIRSIVSLSNVVLFSAALPYQGGTGHINETWIEYWAALFKKNNYVPVDCLRSKIWNNKNICWWYKQNTLLFVNQEIVQEIFPDYSHQDMHPLSYLHPEFLLWTYNRIRNHKQYEIDVYYYRELVDWFNYQDLEKKPEILKKVRYVDTYNVRFNSIKVKIKQKIKKIALSFLCKVNLLTGQTNA